MCYSWLLSRYDNSNDFKKLLITSSVLVDNCLLCFDLVRLPLALVPVPSTSNTSRFWPYTSTTTNAVTKRVTIKTFFCSSERIYVLQ